MESTTQTETVSTQPAPLLLRQIVDAADSLNDEQKEKILWQIKMQKALKAAEELDEVLATGELLVSSEEEIAEIVSKYRKEKYEATLRH